MSIRRGIMRIRGGISPIAVANYLLAKNQGGQCAGIDQMKLNYLVYQCHGWHLAEYGTPLVDELMETTKYGPLFPSVYQQTKDTGIDPLTKPLADSSGDHLTAKQKQLVDAVYADHCQFGGIELMLKTHERGTPFYTVGIEQGRKNFPIRNSIIRDYFKELRDAREEVLDAQYA